jgi:serine/threonine-protein kinase 24/25/MST4
MGFLKIGGGSSPSGQTPNGSTPPGKRPLMIIPEIPPFRGVPGKGQAVAQPSSSKPVAQQPLPSFSPKELPLLPQGQVQASTTPQQPLPPLTSTTNQPQASKAAALSSSAAQLPAQDPGQELTALNSVLIPALEAAMHRRTYMLKELARSSKLSPSAAAEVQQQRVQTHEKVRRLIAKTAGLFYEIQKCDEECPVGMGGGVTEFLEGFLEEVLVRVEASEEPEPSPTRRT